MGHTINKTHDAAYAKASKHNRHGIGPTSRFSAKREETIHSDHSVGHSIGHVAHALQAQKRTHNDTTG